MQIESLIGNADAFPVLRHWDFYNHGGVCPLPRVAADVLRTFAGEVERGAYLDTTWYKEVESLRDSTAKLIHCHPDEVALLKNTSEGLATVANGIDWRAGDRIVTTAIEYPANMYPWMDLAQRFGVELITVPGHITEEGVHRIPTESILAAIEHHRTRLVTLSHVQFATGQRHDIAAVGAVCRSRGILFNVDAIQSLGIIPFDVEAMNVDYLSADGHKWLLGPEGAGLFYCRRELIEQTRASMIGWSNVTNAGNYDRYDFTFKRTAAKFECGTQNIPGFLALKASVDLLLSLGIENVSARLRMLTDRLAAGLQAAGYVLASPRGDYDWSGITSVSHPSRSLEALPAQLRRLHRIEVAFRGGRLRITPHFYNTETQIDRLIEILTRAAAE